MVCTFLHPLILITSSPFNYYLCVGLSCPKIWIVYVYNFIDKMCSNLSFSTSFYSRSITTLSVKPYPGLTRSYKNDLYGSFFPRLMRTVLVKSSNVYVIRCTSPQQMSWDSLPSKRCDLQGEDVTSGDAYPPPMDLGPSKRNNMNLSCLLVVLVFRIRWRTRYPLFRKAETGFSEYNRRS